MPKYPAQAVFVEYDCHGGRRTKKFLDAYEARRFYASKFKSGKNPKVKGSESDQQS